MSESIVRRVLNAVPVVAGGWLLFAPSLLKFNDIPSALFTSAGIGLLIVLVTCAALEQMSPSWNEWTNAMAGTVLVVSPWVFGFFDEVLALLNHTVTGLLVSVIAIWQLVERNKRGRGPMPT